MQTLPEMLAIQPGVTAVIGGGGKTTLLRALADALAGTVILTTSTHIFPAEGVPCLTNASEATVRDALRRSRVVCVGEPAAEGKLHAPALPFGALAALADHVLVEADGAKHLPLKAHQPGEPVIPEEATQVIAVVGLSALGMPITEAAHRPALYARLAGCAETTLVTPEIVARALLAEGLHDRVFLNQAEGRLAEARQIAAGLGCPVVAGSLQRGVYQCL